MDQADQSDPDVKQKQNEEEGLIYKPVKGPGSLTTPLFFSDCLFQHLISFWTWQSLVPWQTSVPLFSDVSRWSYQTYQPAVTLQKSQLELKPSRACTMLLIMVG